MRESAHQAAHRAVVETRCGQLAAIIAALEAEQAAGWGSRELAVALLKLRKARGWLKTHLASLPPEKARDRKQHHEH
jgi:hypothetical protein